MSVEMENAILWTKWSGIRSSTLCIGNLIFRHLSKSFLETAKFALALGITLTGHWGANITMVKKFSARSQFRKNKSRNHAFSRGWGLQWFKSSRPREQNAMSCPKKVNQRWTFRNGLYSRGLQKGEKSGHICPCLEIRELTYDQQLALRPWNEKKQ